MKIPPFLKEKGCIGFVAPSFGCTTEPYRSGFNRALELFTQMGYGTRLGPNCYASSGTGISNTPIRCARELMQFYCDPGIDVLISCGGGETMCEILPFLDLEQLKEAPPKWFMGYSDNTNFTFLSTAYLDTAALYGPCAAAFGMDPWHASLQDAFSLLCGEKRKISGYPGWQLESIRDEDHPFAPYQIDRKAKLIRYIGEKRTYEPIRLSGRLIGGCLDCLDMFLGTPYDYVHSFQERYADEGIIWFLESCDLNVFSIRRVLWQMTQAGWFRHAKGFLIGRPLHFGETIMGLDQYQAVVSQLGDLGVPIIMDLDIGHLPPSMPIISGASAKILCKGSRISIEYSL